MGCKSCIYSLLTLWLAIGVSSCEDKETKLAIEREQARKDSLLRIHDDVLTKYTELKMRTEGASDSLNRIIRENEEVEQARMDREARERQEEKEARRRQEEEQRRIERERGPRWIDGSWNISVTWQNPYTGAVLLTRSSLQIDWEDQTLICVTITSPDNDRTTVRGRYTITDGLEGIPLAISCKGQYWEIDERNHRIGFGDGRWYTK